MRVLHITSTFARGGIASSLWHLLPELRAAGIDLEIAGLYEIGTYGERLHKHEIRAFSPGLRTKYDAGGFARLVTHLRRERYDLIHAHGWPAIFFVALAAPALPRARFFVTEHSVSNRRRRYKLKLLEGWMYRRYERIISVSRAADDALRAWLPETAKRSEVIYNGISLARLNEPAPEALPFSGLKRDGLPLVLCAAGSEYHKGADILIDALASRPNNHGFTLALAGAGRHDAELRERVRASGLEPRVQWLGYIPDVVTQLRHATVFVLPSRREGCPMVILEAMAMGMPVVAARVGGVPELICDHQSGLLVPPENPPALAHSIGMILEDSTFAQKIGASARARVNAFTAEKQAAQLVQCYVGNPPI